MREFDLLDAWQQRIDDAVRIFSAREREQIQNKVIDVLRDFYDTFSSLLEKPHAASSDFITNSILVCIAQLLALPTSSQTNMF